MILGVFYFDPETAYYHKNAIATNLYGTWVDDYQLGTQIRLNNIENKMMFYAWTEYALQWVFYSYSLG
jgi:hypothetical protein